MRIGKRHKLTIPPPSVGLCPIHWTNELQYLGMTFIAGYKLTCNFHRAKARYFGSLNSLFSILGSSPPENLVIALSTANCFPMLDYGLAAIDLNTAQVANLSYVANAMFSKFFSTFCKTTIDYCCFYTGHIPFHMARDFKIFNFLVKLQNIMLSPASILCNWFNKIEINSLCMQYNVNINMSTSVVY